MANSKFGICVVTLLFTPSVGGVQIQAAKQAYQLRDMGYDVKIVTVRLYKKWERRTVFHGLPVLRVGGLYKLDGTLRIGRLGIWPVSLGVLTLLWRLRHTYDVIHVFEVTSLAVMGALAGKLMRKPVLITSVSVGIDKQESLEPRPELALMADTLIDTSFLKIDTGDAETGMGDINNLPHHTLGGRILLKFLVSSNACFQTLSTRGRRYLSSWGIRPERIVHIPTSVDTKKFCAAPDRTPRPEQAERTMTCVARFGYAKGIDVLLHAWKRMMMTSSEWRTPLNPRLRLAGDGELRPQLERIARELNIQDSVEFLGARSDVVDLLQQSWGFVLPSRCEGMPNALLEAMACGLPCIATRVSGSEDLIADGVNGILVEPENPVQMAQALRLIIEDTDLAQGLGREGRATMVRDYQLTHIVQRCVDVYGRLLAENATALG